MKILASTALILGLCSQAFGMTLQEQVDQLKKIVAVQQAKLAPQKFMDTRSFDVIPGPDKVLTTFKNLKDGHFYRVTISSNRIYRIEYHNSGARFEFRINDKAQLTIGCPHDGSIKDGEKETMVGMGSSGVFQYRKNQRWDIFQSLGSGSKSTPINVQIEAVPGITTGNFIP